MKYKLSVDQRGEHAKTDHASTTASTAISKIIVTPFLQVLGIKTINQLPK